MSEAHQRLGRPSISVVVPCAAGPDEPSPVASLPTLLGSLEAQTLPSTAVEVVVVLGGSSRDVPAEEIRRHAPALPLRVLRASRSGEAHARNLGVAAATGRHVLFADPAGSFGTAGLAALLELAGPGIVPHLPVVDAPAGAGTATLLDVAALLPTDLLRQVPYDEDLARGADQVFALDLVARVRFRLEAVQDVPDRATSYDRGRRAAPGGAGTSVGDRYDLEVAASLDVLERLDVAATTGSAQLTRDLREVLRSEQSARLAGHLAEHPADRQRALEDIATRGAAPFVDWRCLNGPADRLAILYCFLPFADTSALVASRRLRARGEVVDVVSNNLDDIRGRAEGNWRLVEDVLSRHVEIDSPATTAKWPELLPFIEQGLAVIEGWIAERGAPYGSMYSRALLPGSHFLAAMVKLRHPETRWLAEFSDPVVWNPYGERRRSTGGGADPTWTTLWAAVEEAGLTLPEHRGLHELCELVAYALADEVLFTNAHQLDFMASKIPPEDARRLRARAVVEHHPVPTPDLYRLAPPGPPLPEDRVNIAYFGAFFATRGLTEIVDALAALAPEDRELMAFHVYTSDPGVLTEQVAQRGLEDVMRVNGYVGYFDILGLVERMDVVLLNDARTRQHYDINPYLPSKWADYSGSSTPIWAVVEPGSMLDGMPVAHKTTLGDVDGARMVLEGLAAARRAASRSLPA